MVWYGTEVHSAWHPAWRAQRHEGGAHLSAMQDQDAHMRGLQLLPEHLQVLITTQEPHRR